MFRRKFVRIVLVGLLCCCGTIVAAYGQVPSGYEGYQVVVIETRDQADLQTLRGLEQLRDGTEIWSEFLRVGPVEMRVSPAALELLKETGLAYEVKIPDFQAYLDLLYNEWGGDFFYSIRTYDEHVQFMQDLAAT